MKKLKSSIVTLTVFTLLAFILATPVFAASWSFTMEYATVSGKTNGQTYSLGKGNRSVTGSVWISKWNDALDINGYTVNSRLYRVNNWWGDTLVASGSAYVNKNGNPSSISMSASNQDAGTYYLYFSKPNNNTTVKGSGTIN